MTSSISDENDGKPWAKEASFRDEHERHHIHDPNDCTIRYTCSQGHKWSRRVSRPCWCGWSKYLVENTPSARIFLDFWCWVGEDNFIIINGKSYKAAMDVRLETNMMTEVDEIVLENEAGFCSILRGVL